METGSNLYAAIGRETRYVTICPRCFGERRQRVLEGKEAAELLLENSPFGDPRTAAWRREGDTLEAACGPLLRELPDWIDVRFFGPAPEREFDALVADAEELCGDDYDDPAVAALYAALGLPAEDEEGRVYGLPDGSLLLVSGTTAGQAYAVAGAVYTFDDGETTEDGGRYLTDDDALAGLRAWVRRGDWTPDESYETVYVRASAESAGRVVETSVRVDPAPPRCLPGLRHEFVAPVEVVGGLPENPGVFGHGGGARFVRVCLACGCRRELDTWGTDRATGREGVPILTYVPDYYTREELRKADDAE